MYAEERRMHILGLLRQKKRVDVGELAAQMEISPETIRRDLREMEGDGLLRRTHGGALPLEVQDERPETPILLRKQQNFELKDRIAAKAATRVGNGDVIAIDNSSTAFCLLRHLPREYRLTVITNSMPVISEILAMPEREWICISMGGVIHPHSYSTFGPLALATLGHFRPNKLFLSCAAIDGSGRLTEGNLNDAEMKRALIDCSQTKYLLADETKFGRIGVINGPDASAVDYLVTNAGINPKRTEIFLNKGVEVIFADP